MPEPIPAVTSGPTPSTTPTAVRKLWLVLVLTFITPGLGHVYIGRLERGGMLLVLILASFFLGQKIMLFPALAPWNIYIGDLLLLAAFGMTVFAYFDVIRLARNQRDAYVLKGYNKWYFYLLIIIVAYFLSDYMTILHARKIPVASMAPSLLSGDNILLDESAYKVKTPSRGEIIIFKYPEDEKKEFIKRVIAVPGDTLEVRNKRVWINGKLLAEPYVQHTDPNVLPHQVQPRDNLGPLTVPPDSYFVMGDNRDFSLDSRFWGFVKDTKITGKAIVIYCSKDPKNSSVRWSRIGTPAQ